MRFSIITLGCKTNQAESSYITSGLIEYGYEMVEPEDNPDIFIINTCTVTSKSDYQSRQMIRRALRTGANVIVTGCYALKAGNEFQEEKIRIIDNSKKHNFFKELNINISNNTLNLKPESLRTRPSIKIQDGCDMHCSYCIVPLVRGRSRSFLPDEILKQIKFLEDSGYHEVVLTGINIDLYGKDLKPELSLIDLIKFILKNTRDIRIRLTSISPLSINNDLLSLLMTGRVSRHLHISLQSGDDRILRIMNRDYNAEIFYQKIKMIKEYLPECNIGVDIIAGFPGEGEEEFNNTYNLIKNSGVNYLHVFPYSRRPGTASYYMKNNIAPEVIKERVSILKNLDKRLRQIFMEGMIGRRFKIVIEKTENGLSKGKTDNYLDVYIDKEFPKGSMVVSEIINLSEKGLRGMAL